MPFAQLAVFGMIFCRNEPAFRVAKVSEALLISFSNVSDEGSADADRSAFLWLSSDRRFNSLLTKDAVVVLLCIAALRSPAVEFSRIFIPASEDALWRQVGSEAARSPACEEWIELRDGRGCLPLAVETDAVHDRTTSLKPVLAVTPIFAWAG